MTLVVFKMEDNVQAIISSPAFTVPRKISIIRTLYKLVVKETLLNWEVIACNTAIKHGLKDTACGENYLGLHMHRNKTW